MPCVYILSPFKSLFLPKSVLSRSQVPRVSLSLPIIYFLNTSPLLVGLADDGKYGIIKIISFCPFHSRFIYIFFLLLFSLVSGLPRRHLIFHITPVSLSQLLFFLLFSLNFILNFFLYFILELPPLKLESFSLVILAISPIFPLLFQPNHFLSLNRGYGKSFNVISAPSCLTSTLSSRLFICLNPSSSLAIFLSDPYRFGSSFFRK